MAQDKGKFRPRKGSNAWQEPDSPEPQRVESLTVFRAIARTVAEALMPGNGQAKGQR
jgi:hypothetical protein